MSRMEESIHVDVPVGVAYGQWTQFESFPSFMDGVESVTPDRPTHNHRVTTIGGVRREFDTVITQQHPDERVAWKSIGGETRQAGVVTFHRLDDPHTRLMIQMTGTPTVSSRTPVPSSSWTTTGSRRTRNGSRSSSKVADPPQGLGVETSLPAERP